MTNEELVLLYQHANAKKSYIEELYNQNQNLIADISKHYIGYADFEDLMQEGFIGLVSAAESWDENKEASFATYAYMHIRAQIHRYVENCGNIIRIPAHQFSNIIKMKRAISAYQQEKGRAPKVKELAKILKLTEDQTTKLISDSLFLETKSSNENISSENDSLTLQDTFEDPKNPIEQLEDEMQRAQLKKVLWEMVDNLPDPEQSRILHAKYEGNLSFEALSQKLNISKGHIRNEESKALRELRRAHNKKKLRAFYTESNIYSMSLRYSSYGYFKQTWTSAPERAVIISETRHKPIETC